MDMSVGFGSEFNMKAGSLNNNAKTDQITSTLKNRNATDEELMEACRSFESYLLEQAFKGMEKTILKDEEEEKNEYLAQFGDKLYEEYAKAATETQSLGIAQILFESMKRGAGSDSIDKT